MPPSSQNPKTRREQSYAIRQSAAAVAATRQHPAHHANHDEQKYRTSENYLSYVSCFTKGLPHDPETGLLQDPSSYTTFLRAVETGDFADIQAVPLGPPHFASGISGRIYRSGITRSPAASPRAWESMAGGLAYDLQGADAQAVTMSPAPTLASGELALEMVELYWMSLLRDIPFSKFQSSRLVARAAASLNTHCWTCCAKNPPKSLPLAQRRRLRPSFTIENVFRGPLVGDSVGPYISQFLLTGNAGIAGDGDPADGYIQYGATRIDQRVRIVARLDFMTTWGSWLDVQDGADVRGRESYASPEPDGFRFIVTPRDLATYVHYDAAYQPYLNACLILQAMRIPMDPGLPFHQKDVLDHQQAFMPFGGPHVLALVAEVSSRAIKAVCFQKYNVHRRLRPEAVGGLLERYHNDPDDATFHPIATLYKNMDKDVLDRVAALNKHYNETVRDRGWPRTMDYDPSGNPSGETRLLPMAYPEGSPMHPSYGAGHATIAGACVTILKAMFDHTRELPVSYKVTDDGRALEPNTPDVVLTVEGELNKLCSNISIGRNWAGVHYYSDYIESIYLGEEVALTLLEEQKLTYVEPFSISVPLFNGTVVKI